ncbi:MAG TPA: hypothetical protein DCY13_11295, partial [Verrucomicrobiales bacterium]|nr:hypothetical protein [Verrucomicrobiales bacterium]
RIGQGIDVERAEAVAGLVKVRMRIANEARKANDYLQADDQLVSAMKADPKNPELIALKKINDRDLLQNQGRQPDKQTLREAEQTARERVATSVKVQNAKVKLGMGQLDEAEAILREAALEDPTNSEIFYYLDRTQQDRYHVGA